MITDAQRWRWIRAQFEHERWDDLPHCLARLRPRPTRFVTAENFDAAVDRAIYREQDGQLRLMEPVHRVQTTLGTVDIVTNETESAYGLRTSRIYYFADTDEFLQFWNGHPSRVRERGTDTWIPITRVPGSLP